MRFLKISLPISKIQKCQRKTQSKNLSNLSLTQTRDPRTTTGQSSIRPDQDLTRTRKNCGQTGPGSDKIEKSRPDMDQDQNNHENTKTRTIEPPENVQPTSIHVKLKYGTKPKTSTYSDELDCMIVIARSYKAVHLR